MHKPHARIALPSGENASGTTTLEERPTRVAPLAPVGAQLTYVARPAAPPRPDRPWLSLGVALAAVAIGSKWALLPFPVENAAQFARWLLRLSIIVAPDVCFAAGLTAACSAVSAALERRPKLNARLWRPFCLSVYVISALYAVASVPMFKVTMVPFTVRLLSFVGGPDVMASSVVPHLPPGIVTGLCLAPLAVLLAPWVVRRWPLQPGRPFGLKSAVAALALVAVYGGVCRAYVRASWTDPNRWERRIAQSPHWVLLASCVEELMKAQPFTQAYSFDAIDDSDFRKPKTSLPSDAAPLLPAGQRPTNVILIVLESTGVEYFGAQGSKYPTTPHLDKLAAEHGIVFENIYSQAASSCKSLIALSASVYDRPDWLLTVRDHPQFDIKLLPQALKDRGYRTCYAHSGYWEWQGRDKFLKARGVDKLIGAGGRPQDRVNSWGINDEVMYQELLDWIDERPEQPFFAFAYTIETHHPYVAPPESQHYDFGVDDEELDRYLNSLRAADAKIAHLLEEIDRRGLTDSTLIAVTADHGESFGQHNQRTHSFGIYEPTVHVPLVLLHPSLKDFPRRQAAVGRHLDIAPTLLDLIGVPAPGEWQGASLLRPGSPERVYFLSVGNEVVLGLRDGDYKYHYYVDTARQELFHLADDPGELRNLADDEPDRSAGYRHRLGGWVSCQREFLAEHGVK